MLVKFDDSTSNQICVVTVKTLGNKTVEDLAYKTFNDWGIGGKKNDNGILLLIALEDRKVKIEVGRGLEGAVTDLICGKIIRDDIKPAFRQGNYLGGITDAVKHLQQAAVGEYKVAKEKKVGRDGSSLFAFIFFIIIIIVIFSSRGNNGGGRYRRSNSAWIIPMLFNNSGWSGGGGSNWGGGGSGWSGGGGFGGFGGGSSSGGGASGGW